MGSPAPSDKRLNAAVACILLAAFALRAGLGLYRGAQDFWENGYTFYRAIADHLLAGEGFRFGSFKAFATPLYPCLIAACRWWTESYILPVAVQSALGAATVCAAFLLGKELFSVAAGVIAAFLTAFYPLYAWHDAVLQETCLHTCLTAYAVYALLVARRRGLGSSACAGLLLGLALLTRPSAALVVPLAFWWLLFWGGTDWRERLRKATVLLAFAGALALPWVIRNQVRVGAPVLVSGTGNALWEGNNAQTFSHYPEESMDLSGREAVRALTDEEREELRGVRQNELAQSRWQGRKAWAFIRADPARFLRGALRKVQTGFSLAYSPRPSLTAQWFYALTYGPVLVLGLMGMLLGRADWPRKLLLLLPFAAFIATSAVFWAHSMHRAHLDVYLMVFAASVLAALWQRRRAYRSRAA